MSITHNAQGSAKSPKYKVIKESIITSILSGNLTPDEQLPTEFELMDRYSVSRVTVRKALKELCAEGYTYSVQGKGTFCSRKENVLTKEQRAGLESSGYSMIVKRHNREHSRRFVALRTEPCSSTDAEVLGIEPEKPVFVLDRLHCVDGRPWVYVSGALHPVNASGFEGFNPIATSLFDIAYCHFGGRLSAFSKRVSVMAADENLAEHLDVEEGFPLVRCDYLSCLLKGDEKIPFESAHAFYRTDILSYLPEYT